MSFRAGLIEHFTPSEPQPIRYIVRPTVHERLTLPYMNAYLLPTSFIFTYICKLKKTPSTSGAETNPLSSYMEQSQNV